MMRKYTIHEWAGREAIITQLYNHDRKSLRDIQTILAEEHGFFPTLSMLKKRIHKWGIGKNFKRKDMLFLQHLIVQRQLQGKPTEAKIRGRIVTTRDVNRYLKRVSPQEAGEESRSETDFAPTCDIEIYTPPPTPTSESSFGIDTTSTIATPVWDEDSLGPQQDLITSGTPVLTIPSSIHNFRKALPPHLPSNSFEGVMRLSHVYYDVVFSRPGWRTRSRTFQLDLSEQFYRNLFTGQSELESGENMALAFKHLDLAFQAIHSILKDGALLFLPYLFHVLVPFASVVPLPYGNVLNQGVVHLLLAYLTHLSSTVLSELHPIRQIASLLLSMSPEERSGSANYIMSQILGRIRVQLELGQMALADFHCGVASLFTLKNKPIAYQTLIDDFAIDVQPSADEDEVVVCTSCSQLGPVVWRVPRLGSTGYSRTRRLSISTLTGPEEPG